jgi:ABC-type ATPase involved in cell division
MIRFEHVTKKYRGTKKPALNDVDFEVQRGDSSSSSAPPARESRRVCG